MAEWMDILDRHYPDWRSTPPPGSVDLYEEGEQALTNTTPVASATPVSICSVTTRSNQVAVLRAVSLEGDRLQTHPGGGNSVYEKMQPTAIRSKLWWELFCDNKTLLRVGTYTSGVRGIQRLRTLTTETGLPFLAVPPSSTATLQFVMLNPAAGETFDAGGAVLSGYLAGYVITLPRDVCDAGDAA